MGTTLAQPATSAGPTERESLATFLQMAADSLGIASRQEQGVLRLEFDPQAHPKWPRPYHIDVPVAPPALGRSQRGDSSPREAWSWLWQRARLAHTLPLARPGRQPEAVHELTDRLFAPYTVEEGQVRLAGCHLVDVPFLRVTRLSTDDPAQVEHQLSHLDGTPVSDELQQSLGLQQLLPHKGPSPLGVDPGVVQVTSDLLVPTGDSPKQEILGVTVIAVKHAEGKLQFDMEGQLVTVEFRDWATTLKAPPYHCPLTGLDTFHLATTSDGRVVAAEGIDVCRVSGKRRLASELVTCSVTGKRVDPELTLKCPVSGEPALATEFATCSLCQQEVSRGVLDATLCLACRTLAKAGRREPPVAQVLARLPRLARYRRFRSASTEEVILVEGVGLWRQVLAVVGRADGELRTVATRTPATSWQHPPQSEWGRLVGP